MTLSISPDRIFRFLLGVIIFLALASLGGHLIHLTTGHDTIFGLRQMFDMNIEHNIPSWYSATALLVSSILLFSIYCIERKASSNNAGYWLFLCAVFQFLAFDEAFSVHEGLWRMGHNALQANGVTYFTWIMPAMVLVLIVFLSSFRFLGRLDWDVRKLMVLSGMIYVGGAAFVEELCHMRMDIVVAAKIEIDLLYVLLSTVEEFMEMFGVILFIYTLLRHIETRFGEIGVRFQSFPAAVSSRRRALLYPQQRHARVRNFR
jgi:hypothetical protein